MAKINRAEILVARCSKQKKLYGMRCEEKSSGSWEIDWSFPLTEERARNENYDSNVVEGSFSLADGFPGCSYCGSTSFFCCGYCSKLSCWDGADEVTCAHCNKTSRINGTISRMNAGGDL